MKNKDLVFDRTCHVLYSKPCEKELKKKIALHYSVETIEGIWTKVQLQYVDFLKDWRTDLGGKKNGHNGIGGTYDCIAILAYYVVCREKTSFSEMEEIIDNITKPIYAKLHFVDVNKKFWKKLIYRAFKTAEKRSNRWGDYVMHVAPYSDGEPIYYEFTACPCAEFAKKHGLCDIMPALCNVDYPMLECFHAKLVRKTTCCNGGKCDYTICGDKDEYLKDHPEYRDEQGGRRNK